MIKALDENNYILFHKKTEAKIKKKTEIKHCFENDLFVGMASGAEMRVVDYMKN